MAKHEVLKALVTFLEESGRESARASEIVEPFRKIHPRILPTGASSEIDHCLRVLKRDGVVQHFPERQEWGVVGRLNR